MKTLVSTVTAAAMLLAQSCGDDVRRTHPNYPDKVTGRISVGVRSLNAVGNMHIRVTAPDGHTEEFDRKIDKLTNMATGTIAYGEKATLTVHMSFWAECKAKTCEVSAWIIDSAVGRSPVQRYPSSDGERKYTGRVQWTMKDYTHTS